MKKTLWALLFALLLPAQADAFRGLSISNTPDCANVTALGPEGSTITGVVAYCLPGKDDNGLQAKMQYWDGSAWQTVPTAGGGGGSGDIDAVTAGNGLIGGGTTGSVTLNVGVTSPLTVAADSVGCQTASGSQDGCLSSADWATFNAKIDGSGTANHLANFADTDTLQDGPAWNSGTSTITGNVSGNAGTATALAANGANCSSGSAPLGVDASGAVEGCFDVATQTELDTHAALTTAHSSTSANTASRIVQRDASGNFGAGTITATLSGNASTATALAANGANCSSGNAPLGVDASGAAEGCFDVATQTELNTHAALTGSSAHGATSANTASQIVSRDASGNFSAGTVTAALSGNASTATALASNPTDCGAGEFATAIDASGNLTCDTPVGGGSETDPVVGAVNGIVKADGAGNISALGVLPRANGSQCDTYIAPGGSIPTAVGNLPVEGGTICLGAGTYSPTGTGIHLGNGSATAKTTRHAVRIVGVVPPVPNQIQTTTVAAATIIDCTGTTNGECITVDGADSIVLENVYLLGVTGTKSVGILLNSARYGAYKHITIEGFDKGIETTTWATFTPGGNWDSLRNTFDHINIKQGSNTTSTHGLHVHAATSSANSDFNRFSQVTIGPRSNAAFFCIELGWSDNNVFDGIHCAGGSSNSGIKFTWSEFNGPLNNSFSMVDIATAGWTNSGSPSSSNPNYLSALGTNNSGTCPNLTGLIVVGCPYTYLDKAAVRSTLTLGVGGPNYCADSGSTDAYACTLDPPIGSYQTGQIFSFKANTANTGAATINFNSVGAKTIKKAQGGITTDLATNDIRAGQIVDLKYDGTNMQMQSTLGNTPSAGSETDPVVGAISGIVKADGAGTISAATAGTDYAAAPSGSANTPLFNNGSGGFTNGTRSGNTTKVVTMDASTPATDDCAKFDANGNLTTAGAACGSGGGSGYATVQDEGSGLTQRATINFTGAGVSCADNSGSTRTDCTISGSGGTVVFSEPGLRLSTETSVPFSTSDRTAQSTIYWTPQKHGVVTCYNGSALEQQTLTSDKSLALSGLTSGKNYDVFYDCDGTALALSSAWTDDTTRADAISRHSSCGCYTLTSDATKLYIGTIRTTGTTTTEDSAAKRFVWNLYNQTDRRLEKTEATASWTYTTDTIRQANNSTANQVEVVAGLVVSPIDINLTAVMQVTPDATHTTRGHIMIGEDSTTAAATESHFGQVSFATTTNVEVVPILSNLKKIVPLGYHKYTWLERGANTAGGTGTITFFGDSSGARRSGLNGVIKN